jgi:hypothetical protein
MKPEPATPRVTWRDYAFAIAWAIAMAWLAVQFI